MYNQSAPPSQNVASNKGETQSFSTAIQLLNDVHRGENFILKLYVIQIK